MIKKSMLAACLAALAFAALPAIAAATYPNPYLAENGVPIESAGFTVSGETQTELTTEEGKFVKCSSVTGNGEFSSPETGSITLTFHGCKTTLGIKCTTPGEESGTIMTTTLPFHLKTVDHEGVQKHGVLITPNEGHFATFKCSFAGTVEVGGTGVVGTITEPAEGVPSNTATLSFAAEKDEEGNPIRGHQTHTKVTNDNGETVDYSLESNFNGGGFEPASQEGEGTITFDNETEPEILTTSE